MRTQNTDGAIDDLGVLITAAYGLDTTWMERGTCYNWGSGRPEQPTPWQVAPGQVIPGGVSSAEMAKYALMVCFSCPAQYDCLAYAIEGQMIAGTWAVRLGVLKWLHTQDDALDLVEFARANGIPVQQIAAEVMADRSTDA